nr:hypothetical protein LTR18_007003 [Exophiala xenobiotica]
MSQAEFESVITKAVSDRVVSGAACVAGRRDGNRAITLVQDIHGFANDEVIPGTVFYEKAFGKTGAEADALKMQPDTVVWVASCTKLLTSISALQCVERGLLHLDKPVSEVLAEFNSPDVLTGFDDGGKPILRKSTRIPTLRQMLTHSSGQGYYGMAPLLNRYCSDVLAREPDFANSSVRYSCDLPLLFEPGERWEYGGSIDWVGKMVERVNGNVKLGEYMKKNIWEVLGMTLTTFRALEHDDVMSRMGGRTSRDESGKITVDSSGWFPIVPDLEDDYGGNGLYTCASDYVKVLMSLLVDDGKLLKSQTVAEFFKPQLDDGRHITEYLVKGPYSAALLSGLPPDSQFNHALGGALVTNVVEGQHERGTMFWGGLPNSFWFIDRVRGVCGIYVSYFFPPGDSVTQALNTSFQKFVHASP